MKRSKKYVFVDNVHNLIKTNQAKNWNSKLHTPNLPIQPIHSDPLMWLSDAFNKLVALWRI